MDIFFSTFSDASVYFVMALIGTALVVLRFILMLVGGDHGGDFHLETADSAVGHGGGFSLFSLLSILAFMSGAGWMGVICRVELKLSSFLTAFIAGGFGFGLMATISFLLYQMRKFNEVGHYDVKNTIGQTGRVYLQIPARGKGRGQVEISVDGRRKVLFAVTDGAEIASFATVRVVGVESDETLRVEAQE